MNTHIRVMTIEQDKRWKAEAEIIKELGEVPSSRKMKELLEQKYAIIANHNTINADLKRDLESLTKAEYANQKAGILSIINKELDIAHNIVLNEADNDLKLKAMSAVTRLTKTKTEILIKFKKAQEQLVASERPSYHVHIGQPRQTDLKKFEKLDGDAKDDKETN